MLWRNALECYSSFKRQIREVEYLNEIINTIENIWEIILSTCLPPRPDELQLKSRKKPLKKAEYTTKRKTVKSVATEDTWAKSDKLTEKTQRSEEGKLADIQAVLPGLERGLFYRHARSAICNSNSVYWWATLHQHAIQFYRFSLYRIRKKNILL